MKKSLCVEEKAQRPLLAVHGPGPSGDTASLIGVIRQRRPQTHQQLETYITIQEIML